MLSLNTEDQPLLYNSFVDYLQLDPSIDLRQRGADGVQADLSIRGASFGQFLVLLNGLRINDAQTGHHNMDIPLPFEAISRIEVLHGAGSTLYGADALGGAVNFITARPRAIEIRARIGFGNFGFNQQRIAFCGEYFLPVFWAVCCAAARSPIFCLLTTSSRPPSRVCFAATTNAPGAVANVVEFRSGLVRKWAILFSNGSVGTLPFCHGEKSFTE